MGFNVFLEARITEKSTGKCITDNADDGWFPVLCLAGWNAMAVLESWSDPAYRYCKDESELSDVDTFLPIPQLALRELCSALFSYAVTPELYRFSPDLHNGYWNAVMRIEENNPPYLEPNLDTVSVNDWDRHWEEEEMFLKKAILFRKFIYELESMHYKGQYRTCPASPKMGLNELGPEQLPDSFIAVPKYRVQFRENPNNFAWQFRIHND